MINNMSKLRITLEDLESKQKIQAEIDTAVFINSAIDSGQGVIGVDYEQMIVQMLLSELRLKKIQQEQETLINF